MQIYCINNLYLCTRISYLFLMAIVHFTPQFNLKDAKVRNLNDIVMLIAHTFRMDRKYFFTIHSDGDEVTPDGIKYPYRVCCTSFPKTGGKVEYCTVCYSYDKIRFGRKL